MGASGVAHCGPALQPSPQQQRQSRECGRTQPLAHNGRPDCCLAPVRRQGAQCGGIPPGLQPGGPPPRSSPPRRFHGRQQQQGGAAQQQRGQGEAWAPAGGAQAPGEGPPPAAPHPRRGRCPAFSCRRRRQRQRRPLTCAGASGELCGALWPAQLCGWLAGWLVGSANAAWALGGSMQRCLLAAALRRQLVQPARPAARRSMARCGAPASSTLPPQFIPTSLCFCLPARSLHPVGTRR